MRRQTVSVVAGTGLVLGAFLTVVLIYQGKPAFIQAISAFGTFAAAVFTLLAAGAAWRAAAASSTTAEHAREALGRAVKPSVSGWPGPDPSEPDNAVGYIAPGGDRGAADIAVTWHLRDGRTVTKYVGDLAPEPANINPHLPYLMPIGAWRGTAAATVEKVVIEYTDLSKTLRWRYVKRFMTVSEWVTEGHSEEFYTGTRAQIVVSDEPIGLRKV